MKAKTTKGKPAKVGDKEFYKIVKQTAYSKPERAISSLAKQTAEFFGDILESHFIKALAEWRQALKDKVKFTTSPSKKLILYEQEMVRVKRSIDSINPNLQNNKGADIEKIVEENLKDKVNKQFRTIFLDQFGYSNKIQIDLKLDNLSALQSVQTLDTSKSMQMPIECKFEIAIVRSGQAQNGYRITLNKNNLPPAILNGFLIKVPSEIFLYYKRDALNQYANEIEEQVTEIRFYQSENSPWASKGKLEDKKIAKPLTRRGFRWLDEEQLNGEKLLELKDKLVEEKFINPIDIRWFKNSFRNEIKREAPYIDWQNSSESSKFGIQKGKGALKFMLYFMYLLTEEFKLAEKQRNYIPYLASSFNINGEVLWDSTTEESLLNTYSHVKKEMKNTETKQWMKTMHGIFKRIFK